MRTLRGSIRPPRDKKTFVGGRSRLAMSIIRHDKSTFDLSLRAHTPDRVPVKRLIVLGRNETPKTFLKHGTNKNEKQEETMRTVDDESAFGVNVAD